MPRALVDLLVRDMRRVDERIAAFAMDLAPPGLELLADYREIRQPQHETGPELLVDAEQFELFAEHAVIAPFDLLESLQVIVKLPLVRPHRAVDALQLRISFVAAPVRPGDREELERADLPRPLDMGSFAQVDEAVVLVDADLAVL